MSLIGNARPYEGAAAGHATAEHQVDAAAAGHAFVAHEHSADMAAEGPVGIMMTAKHNLPSCRMLSVAWYCCLVLLL